jgi:hypothetical protein
MSKHNYRDESRKNWQIEKPNGTTLNNEELMLGCMLRIADNTELMAGNFIKMQNNIKALERDVEFYRSERDRVTKQLQVQKGLNTRLHKKLATADELVFEKTKASADASGREEVGNG